MNIFCTLTRQDVATDAEPYKVMIKRMLTDVLTAKHVTEDLYSEASTSIQGMNLTSQMSQEKKPFFK